MQVKYCYGCHEDPDNAEGNSLLVHRDAFRMGFAPSVDWRGKLGDIPISNQNPTQSCVGHAMALAIAMVQRTAGKWAPLPSALDIYDMARGHDRADVGTTLFAAANAVSQYGWLSEAELPWDPSKVDADPTNRTSWTKRQKAWHRRGLKHHRVLTARREYVTSALSLGLGVVIGCDVGPEFESLYPMEVYAGEPIRLGGHAMALVGFDREGVLVRNSWGYSWCEAGYGKIAWDYIESQKTRSIWVVDSIK